jgi:hypothetical protein
MPLKHSDEISPQDFWNIRKTNSARRVRLVGFKTLCRRYPLLLAEGIRELALVLIFVLFCESYGCTKIHHCLDNNREISPSQDARNSVMALFWPVWGLYWELYWELY